MLEEKAEDLGRVLGQTDEYKALIGKKEYEHLIDMLEKIANYNDEKGITPYM